MFDMVREAKFLCQLDPKYLSCAALCTLAMFFKEGRDKAMLLLGRVNSNRAYI